MNLSRLASEFLGEVLGVLRSMRRFGLNASLVVLACCFALAQTTPTISSISPNPVGIGQSVTVTGTNFGSSGSVTFNGVTATTTLWNTATIVATVPQGTASGNIVVTVSGNSSSGFPFTLNNGPVSYVYDDLGRLAGVIDANGNAAEYFYDSVGNIQSISRFTATQISIIQFSPENGPVGTAVTINGTGFSPTASQNTVKFNGTSAVVSSATNSQLLVTVPSGATTGSISVTSPNGSATSTATFTVTSGNGAPTVTSFSPASGVASTIVNLVGTNFDPTLANDKLRLNVSPAVVSSVTTTTIATTVPAATASGHFTVLTPLGTAVSSQDFYVPFGNHVPGDIGMTARITAGGSQLVTLAASKIGMVLFDGVEGQRVSVGISGSTFSSCTLYLIAPDQTTTATGTCLAGSVDLGSTVLPKTGTYTLGVDPATTSGSVTLKLVADSTGTIIIDGPPVQVTTTAAGQDARLTFAATAGQRIVLYATNVTNPGATFNLVTPAGSTQASVQINNNPSGQTFFIDTQTLATAGVWQLWVQHLGGANVGSETLQIKSVPADFAGSIAIDGSPVTATTTGAGQDARLSFTATAGQRIVLYATNVTNPSATLNLVTPAGAIQTSISISNNPSGQTFFVDTQTLGTTGTWQLWVQHAGVNIGSETLQVNSVPADFTAPLTMPAAGHTGAIVRVPTTGNLAVGQNASLTFSATGGQKVSFNVTNATIGNAANACLLQVLDPNSNQVTFGFCGPGAATYIDTATLATTGTYTVFINPSGTATGTVSVSINNDADVTKSIAVNGATVTATTTVAGQDARLTFTPSQTRIVVFATNVSNQQILLALEQPNGTIQTSMYIANVPSGQTFFIDTQTVTSGQQYQLWLQHSGTNIGSETLQIKSVPADISHTVTIGGAAYQFSTVAGQNANITFSNSQSQSVTVHWTSGTYPSTLQCFLTATGPSPSTTQVGSGNCNTTTGTVSLGTLASGTYNILVDPRQQSTGGMSLTVTTP
jgi:YD repeat-containing protein